MTVRELIEKLQEFHPDLEVWEFDNALQQYYKYEDEPTLELINNERVVCIS